MLVLKKIGLPLRGRPILLSLVRLPTELDSTQSYYHYLLRGVLNELLLEPSADYLKSPCLLELRENAVEVDLRVPGNDIEFSFPPAKFFFTKLFSSDLIAFPPENLRICSSQKTYCHIG